MNTNRFSPRLRALAMATAVALGLGLAASTDAEAHPRGRVHFGVWLGGPMWWGGPYGYPYGSPYVVERPVIVQAPAEPLVVVPSAAQQAQSWYYCRDAQMYYPYVTQCPSAWQEVPATSAPAAVAESPAPAPAPVPAAPTGRTSGRPVPPAPSNR
jgi:hypothetical protein